MRLNQYLAASTKLSRRNADEAIAAGRVVVDGVPAVLGQMISQGAVVTLDHKPVSPAARQTVAFHKPVGYVCSRRRQGNAPTIYSILPMTYHDLETIGRLDKDSSGLLILTNDGGLAQRLSHPSLAKTKVYRVTTSPDASDTTIDRLNRGVKLPDGLSKLSVQRRGSQLEITMTEGRNRQIRRTMEAVGLRVTQLERIQFGRLLLGSLKPREVREVKAGDLE